MKNYDKIKTLQLIVYVLLTVIALVVIFTNKEVYHFLAVNHQARILFAILWLSLGLAFAFMFFDFSSYSTLKREYSELDLAIFSDPVTGLANRNSCDAFIEKYLDKPLPKEIGCITLEIINLQEINKNFGHRSGNNAIKDFSGILQSCSAGICFVGRNGGNKFLAIFQNCDKKKMDDFLGKVETKVKRHNERTAKTDIIYKFGCAFDEGDEVNSINELIALSNRRSIESYRTFSER